jgi:hypothetical protein
MNFTESVVEQAALAWLENLGWSGEPGAERANSACCNVTRSTVAGATA